MATSHSLSRPTSPSIPRASGDRTSSRPSSRPSSPPISVSSRLPYGPTQSKNSAMSTSSHHWNESSGSRPRNSFPNGAPAASTQTTMSFHSLAASGSSSSTHAGGILPSASFFRPTRPTQYQTTTSMPVPPLAESNISTHEYQDQYPLAPLAERYDAHSEMTDVSAARSSSPDEHRHQLEASARSKHSREPLLPIGGRGTSPRKPTGTTPPPPGITGSHPSLTQDTSTRSLGGTSSATGRGRVKDGMHTVERVFKSGLSLDNIRRSLSSIPQPSPVRGSPIENGMHFEPKTPHDEHDVPSSPISRRKESMSPSRHSHSLSMSQADPYEFNPIPPADVQPPLSAVPVLDPKTGKPMRKHQLHPSRNRFSLQGRLLTGGDSPWAFVGSLTTLFVIAGVWFGTTCVWWWNVESPAVALVGAYMCLLTISSMFATAFRDPGILPRNLDPDPPCPAAASADGSVRMPLPRDLKVRAGVVRVKYCPTCKTYRPPRSSHCKMCDNCVDGCDHHCQWVNNCVGRRNYTTFFVMLVSSVLTLCMVICTTAIHIYLLTRRNDLNFAHALNEGAGSAVVFCLSILVVWPVTALLVYHMRLLLLNVTTIEQIRNQAHKTLVPGPAPPNPFSHGSWRRNLVNVICRPPGYSWLDGSAIATEDKRRVNPGMASTTGQGNVM